MNEAKRNRLSVFVASTFIDAVQAELAAAFELTFAARGGDPIAELVARGERGEIFDVVLLSLDVAMTGDRIGDLPASIKALATYSVGTDHIDLEAATSRGLAVFNTPGVLADSVAENAIFLMLGAARRATENIDLLRSRTWSGWNPTQVIGVQLSGRTLGILGMGDIGKRIASRSQALGMKILYCNRRPLPDADALGGGYRATPGDLIADSDVLILACPATKETLGVVNSALLSRAKPGLILVNIARGNLVDDEALVTALREGRVWAAGLDVFNGEPQVDPRYFDLPNVFMVPHIGSSTVEARLGMGRILIDGITGWQAGKTVANRVA